jgi:predicted phosphoadenosine phosphosulfate sulfurtransferase
VRFIDQEAEWDATIDYVRTVMYDPRVEPLWLQVPIRLFNATSAEDSWLHCWGEGEEWMRERDPIAFTDNVFGTDRFKELFSASLRYFTGGKACSITGVRAQESPARRSGLTSFPTYKWATWGKKEPYKDLYSFHPIYD